MDDTKCAARNVEYVAPPITVIEDFAGLVCTELAARSGDPRFADAQTIRGFADFLHVLLTIEARRRNRKASFDMPDKTAVEH